MYSRRDFLKWSAGAVLSTSTKKLWAKPGFKADPFALGVASGYPTPTGVVLWTRLAPSPLEPGGGMPGVSVPARFEVSEDSGFRRLTTQGVAYATPDWGHSIHVEVEGLQPDRWYWYRFHSGNATSPIGRTRTAPALGSEPTRLRFAFASCQNYEHGFYAAYRHMLADDLDLIVHLGDYIYETSSNANTVRRHEGPEPVTLADYRARYARYKSDPDLQAAHAHCPWMMVWDDHEVENDYAGTRSENDDEPRWFIARRASAYQAYYEHMPLRRTMIPFGPDMRIHTRSDFGALAQFHLLDDRQYRTPQPCVSKGGVGPKFIEGCEERENPQATLLGERQERWLESGLTASKARWNILAQQSLMAQADYKSGAGQRFFSDSWDGYPAARRRLLDFLAQSKPVNPVVISGDVHSFWVNDLKPEFDAPGSPVVATEFVGTSISSNPPPETEIQIARKEGAAHIHFATGEYRGYVRMELTSKLLQADFRALADVHDQKSTCKTLNSWIVEDAEPGAKLA